MPADQKLDWMLSIQHQRFDEDRSSALIALQALAFIFARHAEAGELDPGTNVGVPWWVVGAIAVGLMDYDEALKTVAPKTLGEALGVEGDGQGREPLLVSEERLLRNIRISLRLALAETRAEKLEAVKQELASEAKISISQVERIWAANSERARAAVQRLGPAA